MKLRFASVGRDWRDFDVARVGFWTPASLADFDVVIVDPLGMDRDCVEFAAESIVSTDTLARRQSEIADVLSRRGGIVITYLRAPIIDVARGDFEGRFHAYSWFPELERCSLDRLLCLRPGIGTDIALVNPAHAFAPYLTAFRGYLLFEAEPQAELPSPFVTIAESGTKRPIAFSAKLGQGTFVCVPPNRAGDVRKECNVLLDCARRMLGSVIGGEVPEWVSGYRIPGDAECEQQDTALAAQEQELRAQRTRLDERKQALELVRMLLYASGKWQLEAGVRNAICVLGFRVVEECDGDADVYADSDQGFVVGEVEGTSGQVDIDKLRQLIDYHVRMLHDQPGSKGILFGNGHRTCAPSERPDQFTEAALAGARRYGFCLVPTCELFKAVCFVLGHTGAEAETQKAEIRKSMLDCVGVWRFEEPR